jgi:hypothetical protein
VQEAYSRYTKNNEQGKLIENTDIANGKRTANVERE